MLKKRCLNKRGFALQFNWLFVLIGGAIFIGFFFSLIMNQASQAEKGSAVDSTRELDTLLKVSSASGETQKVILFGAKDQKITFSCDEISEYLVEGSDTRSSYNYYVIFSPTELKGRKLVTQTLIFEAPFRVMPFVYVTDTEIEYVFVGEGGQISPLLNLIINEMPLNATKNFINPANADIPDYRKAISAYKDNNYERTVFIASNTSILNSLKLNNFQRTPGKVFGIAVMPGQETIAEYGNLTFFHYNQTLGFESDGESPFIRDGIPPQMRQRMALGGVISHNKGVYECNLRKLLKRTELLSKLHKDRLVYYYDNSPAECQLYYWGDESADTYLEDIKSYVANGELTSSNFNNLFISINKLAVRNNLLLSQGCARIY